MDCVRMFPCLVKSKHIKAINQKQDQSQKAKDFLKVRGKWKCFNHLELPFSKDGEI